jgi:enoyl-CoA hydratase/carnithine racemase
MTGETVDAERAREMGLVSVVVEPQELDAVASRLVEGLAMRLEAEIALKESLVAMTPWTGDVEDAMQRGVQAVFRWASRPK